MLMLVLLFLGQKHSFTFDRVFAPDALQEEVFTEISQLVQSALDGYKVIQSSSAVSFVYHFSHFSLDFFGSDLSMLHIRHVSVMLLFKYACKSIWIHTH